MIVFSLGTISFPFDRTVDWLDSLLKKQIITEPVLFQHGSTSVSRIDHPLLTSVRSLTKAEMQKSIEQASLVVAHGGQGSTRMLANMGASFVLLPRLKCYGEHIDDHQLLFARAVAKLGIEYCTDLSSLANYIKHPPLPFEGQLFEGPSLAKHFGEFYRVPLTKRVLPRVNLNPELYYD